MTRISARSEKTVSPMYRQIFGIAFVAATLLPPIAGAQTPQPLTKEAPKETAKDVPKAYVPGLEQFMNVILIEHDKLWFAGNARNWPLAAYELGEIKEVMSDVQDHVPVFKSLPLADMMDAVITKEIADLEKAVEAKDFKTFAAGYDKLTAACNACHQGTENGFIVIQRPSRPAFTNQDYRPHR
ncbi:MAG TPA: hypothetical protein VKG24_05345 [Pseudolabrys sp.]|nr:hypothetical protein [Pseudolabrys sp.]